MEDLSGQRVASLLEEASTFLGEGLHLVVTDDGETFWQLTGLRGTTDEYAPWSSDQAQLAARRFNVDLVDEGEPPDAEGERGYEAFRLVRSVGSSESVADAVQAMALAIDGVLALHTLPTVGSRGSHFWDYEEDPAG